MVALFLICAVAERDDGAVVVSGGSVTDCRTRVFYSSAADSRIDIRSIRAALLTVPS